jgi:hypothetical protein
MKSESAHRSTYRAERCGGPRSEGVVLTQRRRERKANAERFSKKLPAPKAHKFDWTTARSFHSDCSTTCFSDCSVSFKTSIETRVFKLSVKLWNRKTSWNGRNYPFVGQFSECHIFSFRFHHLTRTTSSCHPQFGLSSACHQAACAAWPRLYDPLLDTYLPRWLNKLE